MTTHKEALTLAVDRLELFVDAYPHDITVSKEEFLRPFKEALAQPAVAEQHNQEPVAILQCQPKHGPVLWHDVTEEESNTDRFHPEFFNFRIVYTTPPQRTWVGLTDDEMKKVWYAMQNIMGWYSFQEIAKAIELELNDKNT